MENEKEKILDSLEPLFKEAEEKGLWFYSVANMYWFSPAELRGLNKSKMFVWPAEAWQLRDPKDLLTAVEANLKRADEAVASVRKKMGLSH